MDFVFNFFFVFFSWDRDRESNWEKKRIKSIFVWFKKFPGFNRQKCTIGGNQFPQSNIYKSICRFPPKNPRRNFVNHSASHAFQKTQFQPADVEKVVFLNDLTYAVIDWKCRIDVWMNHPFGNNTLIEFYEPQRIPLMTCALREWGTGRVCTHTAISTWKGREWLFIGWFIGDSWTQFVLFVNFFRFPQREENKAR